MQNNTKPAKSLVTRLSEACDAVAGVDKSGYNEFQRYKYVKAADVAKAIRHELFRRKIMLLADEKEITEKEVQTNNGGTIRLLTLRVEYTLLDGLSDQKITTTAYGVAMDSGDKAIYKAKTGALKYFLRGLGIIPDERDDPEADESVDEQTDARLAGESPKKKGKGKKVADYQRRAFDSACAQTGKTAQQIATYLQTKFSVASVAELPADEFQTAIKWALGTDLKQALEDTIEAIKKIPQHETKAEPRYEAVNQ
jgi:hypothetical protein